MNIKPLRARSNGNMKNFLFFSDFGQKHLRARFDVEKEEF
jgi:hypothetical protein